MAATTDFTASLSTLWDRVHPDDWTSTALHGLFGIPLDDIADLAVLVAAASDDAGLLIRTTPYLLRGLRSSTTMAPERCVGHVQGPILWSETLNARAHTLGGDDVFVCGVMRRDYDTPENEVLLSALDLIARAGLSLEHAAARHLQIETVERVRARSVSARSLRAERLLDGVRRNRAGNRQVHRTEVGRHARRYEPALAVLRRRHVPFHLTDLPLIADLRTRGQLRGLALMCDALARRGADLGTAVIEDGEVVIGPLHHRSWRNATGRGNFGSLLGQVLIDSPGADDATERARVLHDLEARAGRRRFCLVATPDEADMAVDLALDASS